MSELTEELFNEIMEHRLPNGATLDLVVRKVDALGEEQWRIKNHVNLPDLPTPDPGQITVQLEEAETPAGFDVNVFAACDDWGDGLTHAQCDADFPYAIDFTGASKGDDLPSSWSIFGKADDGHANEGLTGAYGPIWKPQASRVHIITLHFTGDMGLGYLVDLKRCRVGFFGYRRPVAASPRVTPGS